MKMNEITMNNGMILMTGDNILCECYWDGTGMVEIGLCAYSLSVGDVMIRIYTNMNGDVMEIEKA